MLAVITAVGTSLLGGGKRLLALLGKLNIWQLLCIALFATSAVFFVQRNVARGERDSARVNLNECRKGRVDDRKAYEGAQAQAKADMLAENRRIEAEQQRKTNELQSRYQSDLARLRAGGVRKDLAAPKSATRQGGATGVPEAACRDDAENLCVSRSLVMRAAEIELGRNALIDWINEQLLIDR